MPAKRGLTMRQLRYLLRLHHDRVSTREIGRLLGVARSTIQDNLKRAAAAGLQWPLPEEATDDVLEQRLFGRTDFAAGRRRRVEPDWAALARELKRPGVPRLFADLALAHGDARYGRMLRTFARTKLLILDDWGPESLSSDQARDLLEIIEDRYDKGSLIITSQVPVDRWHDMIGIPTLADAILDRVVHNAYRLDLSGESLRKQSSPAKSTSVK